MGLVFHINTQDYNKCRVVLARKVRSNDAKLAASEITPAPVLPFGDNDPEIVVDDSIGSRQAFIRYEEIHTE